MTDMEKLTALLTEFGVEWRGIDEGVKCGGFEERKKITGYRGFFTLFEFDKEGNFLEMGAWE